MKTVVITGANRGLGLALDTEFRKRKWNVIATSSERPTPSCCEYMDLRLEHSIDQFASQFGKDRPIDLLINNAAMLHDEDRNHDILTMRSGVLDKTYFTNVSGALIITQKLWNAIMWVKGRVINISSTDALCQDDCRPAYSISKAALNAVTKKFSLLGKRDGVQVCAVHPGWMRTDMGGKDAPVDPKDSAKWIANLAEGSMNINGGFFIYGDNGEFSVREL